jgi:hypothetical protein
MPTTPMTSLPLCSHICIGPWKSKNSHYSSVSNWFTLVLWYSQWELMGWLPGCFLLLREYNPTFLQAICFVSCWFLAWLTLQPRTWRQHVPSKHRLFFSELHSSISQEVKLFINIRGFFLKENYLQ